MGSIDRCWALAGILVLLACHGTPNPGSTQPPPVANADAPASPPLTWADVQAELPDALAYVPTEHANPPAWLQEVDTLWLRLGDACHTVTLPRKGDDRAALEECHETLRKADVSCTRSLEVGHTLRVTNLQICSATLATGEGGMGSAMSSSADTPVWSLVDVDDTRLRYATTWALCVEAEKLVWVDNDCTPDSVATLTNALLAEGLTDHALGEALNQRHGVVGQGRRCMEHHGVSLLARRSEDRSRGDRGADSRREPGLHDCTIPCPETTQSLQRINAVLGTRPFALATDATFVELHRTQAACEATPEGGLPALTENPCHGSWLDEVVTPRGKRR